MLAEPLLGKLKPAVAAGRTAEDIARAAEALYVNREFGTCTGAAMQQAIAGARAGFDAEIITMVFEDGEKHAITALTKGGKTTYLSYGDTFATIDEIAREAGYDSFSIRDRGNLGDWVKMRLEQGKDIAAPPGSGAEPVEDVRAPSASGKPADVQFVEPTPDDLAIIETFRDSVRGTWEAATAWLNDLFPDAEVMARLKASERIWEKFFRKAGTTLENIDDVCGTCVVVETLGESAEAVAILQDAARARDFGVYDPKSGWLSPQDIVDLLTKDKGRFRTTGFVFEIDGVKVEMAVQTWDQFQWAEIIHDTPVYKPNLFQAEWGIDELQMQLLRDYSYDVSKYLHYRQLLRMAEDGTFKEPLVPVPRPAIPDWNAYGTTSNARMNHLIKLLEELMDHGPFGQR